MTKFKSFIKYILGNKDQISAELYIFTLTTFIASILVLILCFIHIIIGLNILPVILAGISSVIMLGLYFLVRIKNFLLFTKIIFTVGGIVMLDLTWYLKFLSNGPVLYLILIFAALVIWMWDGKQLMFFLISYFLNIAVLFYVDFNSPDFLFKYPDLKTRSIDIFLSFFFYSILVIFLLYSVKRELIKQKENAIKSDKLKSAFLANMSHEIRTPMNGILGFSELLKNPDLPGQKQQQYVEMIEKSGHRMLSIINNIIDISKIEAGLTKMVLTETDINKQLDYIYMSLKSEVEAKGMKLVYSKVLTAKESIIKTDREKLIDILTVLIKNAIKYSKKGEIEFGNIKKSNHLEFYVKDTGIGIPKDRQNSIFERFIQADIKNTEAIHGAGLGLAITKSYVTMLGGKIWVKSEEGIGSTFYFTLPYNS